MAIQTSDTPDRLRSRKLPAFLILAGILAFISGCNMIQGLGDDIHGASQATEKFIGGNPND